MTQFLERSYTAAINISANGDSQIIAAPGVGHYIAIDLIQLFVPVAVGVTLKSGSTSLTGKYSFVAGQSDTIENSPKLQSGCFQPYDNTAFNINLDAAQQCSGFVTYRIIGE